MVSERTLFERLANPDQGTSRRLTVDVNRLRKSVILHLRKMLNTRHGHAPAQPDYGIPDLNEFMFSMPESITPMRQAIQTTIEKYEPRLSNVKVSWTPDEDDPLNICFEIEARLQVGDKAFPVSFTTNVGSARGIEIIG